MFNRLAGLLILSLALAFLNIVMLPIIAPVAAARVAGAFVCSALWLVLFITALIKFSWKAL